MRRLSGQLSTGARCRRVPACLAFALIWPSTAALAQDASSTDQQQMVAIEAKLDELNQALSQTEKMLEKSRAEIQSLHSQLDALRAQTCRRLAQRRSLRFAGCECRPSGQRRSRGHARAAGRDAGGDQATRTNQGGNLFKIPLAAKRAYSVQRIFQRRRGRQRRATHDRHTSFSRIIPWQLGRDRTPDPAGARRDRAQNRGSPQLCRSEPRFLRRRLHQQLRLQFFRRPGAHAPKLGLVWTGTEPPLEAGYTVPLISPLSPTSYATVAQPGLAGSGNLWTWSPQIQVEQRIPLTEQRRIGLEGGLIDPPASGYTSDAARQSG